MFEGHFGVGKTTLVRQLQGLSAEEVESTDGIDVYRGKCYYNMETKEWITPGCIFYSQRIQIKPYLSGTVMLSY